MNSSSHRPPSSAASSASGETPVYSPWLGPIARHQFEAALARFDLGDFVEATTVPVGLYGQNVFLTSTRGRYVFRGRPVQPSQFQKESFGYGVLHDRSDIPVPHPYLVDDSSDIFGWPYVLMPRLGGRPGFDPRLTVGEQVWVARAAAKTLVRLQEITWPFAGEYDPASKGVRPFSVGYPRWLVNDTRGYLEASAQQGLVSVADAAWVEGIIAETASAVSDTLAPCLVTGDYHPDNLLVVCEDGEWRVSGLVDVGDFHFGGAELDLVRTIGIYLDIAKHEETRLARVFGQTYLQGRPARPGFAQRYRLAMLRDRLGIWELGKRRQLGFFFPPGFSFRQYIELYLDTYRLFASSA